MRKKDASPGCAGPSSGMAGARGEGEEWRWLKKREVAVTRWAVEAKGAAVDGRGSSLERESAMSCPEDSHCIHLLFLSNLSPSAST